MCCLFGVIDSKNVLTGAEKSHIISVLAEECEARGTDATGIAYNSRGRLYVYKRPLPAHRMRFIIPNDASAIMGHTRMTTQGSEYKNYNNHPFIGRVSGMDFALAHNGILHNDRILRKTLGLPRTKIQTDSYIAVQLLEAKRALDLTSLKDMAEQVEGTFSFTVLDRKNNLYFIKGDNPLCICYHPKSGLFAYASTEEILSKALKRLRVPAKNARKEFLECGTILKIDSQGRRTTGNFDTKNLRYRWYMPYEPMFRDCGAPTDPYVEELKAVAGAFGYTPEDVDTLLSYGFSPEELEEYFYLSRN